MVRTFKQPLPRKIRYGKPLPRVPLVKPDCAPRGNVSSIRTALSVAEKRQAIFDLRLQGHSIEDIGRAVEMSAARVAEILTETLKNLAAHTKATAEELRAMEIARLDKLLITHWPMRMSVKTSELILGILERRHKIAGLDVVHTVHTGLNDGPIQVAPAIDLHRLDDEELQWFERIVAKAGNQAIAHAGMNGVDFTLVALEHQPTPTS